MTEQQPAPAAPVDRYATVLVALMETMPSLNPPEYLAAVTTGYVLISFAFALIESLLALKIAPLLTDSREIR